MKTIANSVLLPLCLAAFFASTVAAQPGPRFGHVFVIVLENEGYDATFGGNDDLKGVPDKYLRSLGRQGALLENYFAIGHNSLDNYIAMISGQGPNYLTQSDCQNFAEFTRPDLPGPAHVPSSKPGDDIDVGAFGQAVGQGCVYPRKIPTFVGQLGKTFTWKAYMEDMGLDHQHRESSLCGGHPASEGPDKTQKAEDHAPYDQYAMRHDPFVYFHSILDNRDCAAHVVDFQDLKDNLARVETTANFVFITPNLCNDGHDGGSSRLCVNGEPGGLTSADKFLHGLVPTILRSPAYKKDGLLIITFDEADTDDTSSCCGEQIGPNIQPSQRVFGALDFGPGVGRSGGGRIGAVVLGPHIAPHHVCTRYNHYSLLKTLENNFLSPKPAYLGYAGAPDVAAFGTDIFDPPKPGAPRNCLDH